MILSALFLASAAAHAHVGAERSDAVANVSGQIREVLGGMQIPIWISDHSAPSIHCQGPARDRFVALGSRLARAEMIEDLSSQALETALGILEAIKRSSRRMSLASSPELAFARQYFESRGIKLPDTPVLLTDDEQFEAALGGMFVPVMIRDELRPGFAEVEISPDTQDFADCIGGGQPIKLRFEAPGEIANRGLAEWGRRNIGGTGLVIVSALYGVQDPLSRSMYIHELRHYADFVLNPEAYAFEVRKEEDRRLVSEFDSRVDMATLRADFMRARQDPRYADYVRLLEESARLMPIDAEPGKEPDLAWEAFRAFTRQNYTYLFDPLEVRAYEEQFRYLSPEGRRALETLVAILVPSTLKLPGASGELRQIAIPAVSHIAHEWAVRIDAALASKR